MSLDLFLIAAVICWTAVRRTDQAIPVTRCDPAGHICEGRCPDVPLGVELPPDDSPAGLCLKEPDTGACVCWLRNPSPDKHLQTLFKCEVASHNGTAVRHVMCLPPSICFPPGAPGPGCLIVPHCPCTHHGRASTPSNFGVWRTVVAFILRSRTPVPSSVPPEEAAPEKPPADIREFSMKHLLFLLAFVIGPLLCWCLLTFFHEGKCRKKRRTPETEPMPTERVEELGEENAPPSAPPQSQQPPTHPKFECPPPYREAADPGEDCLLEADCGPPPSYEDAVRDQWRAVVHRIEDVDSE